MRGHQVGAIRSTTAGHLAGKPALFLAMVLALPAAAAWGADSEESESTPVIAIDVMETKPGLQADYLRYVELNWANARRIARERGYVRDFEVLARAPAAGEWDVMLRTTYPSRAHYEAREANFAEVFDSPDFEHQLVNGRGGRELASFLDSGTPARAVLTSPRN